MHKNEGYLGNINVKRAGVQAEWTEEQILEYKKCMGSPIHFIENYIYGPVRDSDIIRTVKARTYIETGSGEISSTDTSGRVVEQVVTPVPSDADPDSTFTYNETTDFFEQPTVTYSDDKSSDPK